MNGVIDNAALKVYRVFKNKTEFVTIEAASATEAVVKSGIEKVFMIRSGARDDMTMLDRSMLASEVIPAAIAIETPPPATA